MINVSPIGRNATYVYKPFVSFFKIFLAEPVCHLGLRREMNLRDTTRLSLLIWKLRSFTDQIQ